MVFQQTLQQPVALNGIGLHSGQPARLVLNPARPGHGIVFARTDIPGAPQIPADFRHVVCTQLATTLGTFDGKVTISTVEHVLAALMGMGIDNALVEIDGPEVPIMDGSSAPFSEAIQRAGIVSQAQLRPYLVLRRRVEVKVGEKWAFAEPSARLEVHGSIEWDHPSVGYQEFHYVDGKTSFAELSGARTFCFLRDVEAMRARGLARGGSLQNAVVLNEALVLNPEGLRYPDELARHKVLDALGDFKLAGVRIHAFVRMHRAGHDLHAQLLKAIFSNADNYELIDASSSVTEEIRPSRVASALSRRLVASVS